MQKRVLLAVGSIVGALVLVVAIVLLVLGMNARHQLQRVASDVLGMDVNVAGQVSIGFLPRFHITAADVQVRNHGSDVASAVQATFVVAPFALLGGEIRLERVELRHVRVTLERQRDGTFNFATQSAPAGGIVFAATTQVALTDASLVYTDRSSGKNIEADSCDLDVRNLQRPAQQNTASFAHLSFTATLACGAIRSSDFVVTEVKSSIAGKDGILDFNPATISAFGGSGSGTIHADVAGPIPSYVVQVALSKFRLAQSFRILSPRIVGDGPMDFSASLSLQGATRDALVRSAAGEASLRGHDLTLDVGDLDQALARYATSQNFNLVDVGAIFFAGPLGLAVTKGFNFASIFQSASGTSQIRTLVSEWHIERGVAQAKDVAMATKSNRVAMKGGLDLINRRFQDVTVALVDAQGCAIALQKIRGPFDRPDVVAPNILTTLAGPVQNLIRRAGALLGGKCDVFYAGAVPPPH